MTLIIELLMLIQSGIVKALRTTRNGHLPVVREPNVSGRENYILSHMVWWAKSLIIGSDGQAKTVALERNPMNPPVERFHRVMIRY